MLSVTCPVSLQTVNKNYLPRANGNELSRLSTLKKSESTHLTHDIIKIVLYVIRKVKCLDQDQKKRL